MEYPTLLFKSSWTTPSTSTPFSSSKPPQPRDTFPLHLAALTTQTRPKDFVFIRRFSIKSSKVRNSHKAGYTCSTRRRLGKQRAASLPSQTDSRHAIVRFCTGGTGFWDALAHQAVRKDLYGGDLDAYQPSVSRY